MEKEVTRFQEYLMNKPEDVDIVIHTLVCKGTIGILLKLPRGTNGKVPTFDNDMLVQTIFDVNKFSSTSFPSIIVNQIGNMKDIYVGGTGTDKVTATFTLGRIPVLNFASNPILKVNLSANAFVMDGKKPYLEILVAKLGKDGTLEYYQPIKGTTNFGEQEINLLTNQIPRPD